VIGDVEQFRALKLRKTPINDFPTAQLEAALAELGLTPAERAGKPLDLNPLARVNRPTCPLSGVERKTFATANVETSPKCSQLFLSVQVPLKFSWPDMLSVRELLTVEN
jgi:hypothetical protein